MSKRKRIKAKRNLYKNIAKLCSVLLKALIKWLRRSLLVTIRKSRRQPHFARSGFVLPTAMMVLLVVILLTTAMMLRSFDRARNASNVRASQAAIKAATPAISRAEVKIEELLKAPTLQRETPSELALYNAIKNNPKYTFGDETRLRLAFDLNNDNLIQTSNTNLENDETLTTAWRFPVDTDNNGKFDSYTLYGIYFRSPNRSSSEDARGNLNRSISPLETRLAPITTQIGGRRCDNLLGNSTSLLGNSGWYKSGDELKKSFFVYTASVPIIDNTGLGTAFEKYSGNSSFYALEYQQDQSRILQNNYAVLFDGDLQLAPNSDFRLNGRVHTNGNLLVGGHNNAKVRFYQVSDKSSCFYREENAKITVGGNVANGSVTDRLDGNTVDIDLFDNNPEQDNAQIGSNNKSTETSGGEKVAYNHDAYNQRIALMKREALSYCREENKYCSELNPPRIKTVLDITRYPQQVKNTFSDRLKQNPSLNAFNILSEELELYFKQRTRRVPYAEIENPDDVTDFYTEANIFPGVGIIEPPVKWREPTVTNTKLQLKTQQIEATFPEQQQGIEKYLGDRIKAGNNLPAYWKNGKDYITTYRQYIDGVNWTEPDNLPRYRTTQIQPFDNLNMAERDNFWEDKAANSGNSLVDSGGLRIITGTGIYQHKGNPSSKITKLRDDSFLAKYLSTDFSRRTTLDSGEDIPEFPQDLRLADEEIINQKYALVWHDTMPMKGNVDPQGREDIAPPDLRMRATAVYDYRDTLYTDTNYINRTPTVCISSYYDPTDSLTARNPVGLPDVSGDITARLLPAQPAEGVARSNNGVVYSPPYTNNSGRIRAIATYLPELKAQAKLMFPNGRIVNEPLQKALSKLNNRGDILDLDKPLSLSENSAIDTAICSLEILDGTLKFQSNPVIPHGAIREATFLDGREVKAIYQQQNQPDGSSSDNTLLGVSTNQYLKATDYNLELEQRQPLEIRLTEINLDTNETKGITRKELNLNNVRNEYVLPNSGIIYATRDDALVDDSFNQTLSEESDRPTETKLLSPTDFKLDPTRRPNGIRLVNGSNLSRTRENTYRPAEKGLILATNLPVYIKGDFNLHQTPSGEKLEEFLEELQLPRWDNFYSRNPDLNPKFACRPGKLGCSDWEEESDTWRPATIISDAVTLLSNTFNDGFRHQGDYDLNNNAGSGGGYDFNGNGSLNDRIDEKDVGIDLNYDGDIDDVVVEKDLSQFKRDRKNNGFWDNSFVTSAFWWNQGNADIAFPNQKTNDSYVSSYLTNGVTPIQRRTNFPEYVMEICRKIPVSECKPNDWVAGYDFDGDGILKNLAQQNELGVQAKDLLGGNIPGGAKVERLGAGTTARPALMEADRRYPRRV
ncbi:MAG TPA: hypothetical protein DEV81_23075, partial [Cyanobacteria bacterium UBA11049]|nr:hypothetical protein [Cyanobacteria bacterium UBA11049]